MAEDKTTTELTAATGIPAGILALGKMPPDFVGLVVSIGAVLALITSCPASGNPRKFLIDSLQQLTDENPPASSWNGVYFSTWLDLIKLSELPATPPAAERSN